MASSEPNGMLKKSLVKNEGKSNLDGKTHSNNSYDVIQPKLKLKKDFIKLINEYCDFFTIKIEVFIIEAIYDKLIFMYESPEAIFDKLRASTRFITLFEKIRKQINFHYGKDFLHQKDFSKGF
ncbi:hypothetical protein LCGC14_1404300 [marine sediment metagenome]|uniref:Uncharacterized protein n=1 Tax=marine sediment metagenome TaxID=412755 RepID=A0A0F9MXQ6_9ZZZZ